MWGHQWLNERMRFDGTDVLYDHGDNAGDPDPDVARRGSGNIAVDGTRRCVYDAMNRLKEAYKKDAGGEYTVQVAAYTYNALGRRIRKVVSGGGVPGGLPDSTTDYLYADVQCIKERDGTDQGT